MQVTTTHPIAVHPNTTPTAFALLCDRCGLSMQEAVRYLDVAPDMVLLWARDVKSCPDHIIGQLRLLYRQISAVAEQAMQHFIALSQQQGAMALVELSVAVDDAAAQKLGLPCVGAHRAALGMVIARAHGTRFLLTQ